MEPEGSLPHSQASATCPLSWASSIQSTPHILKIRLNVIVPSMPGSPKWSLSFRFPHQNPVYASTLPPIRATCPAHLILLHFVTRTLLGEGYITLYLLNIDKLKHNFEATWSCCRIAVKFGMWHCTRRICPANLISVRPLLCQTCQPTVMTWRCPPLCLQSFTVSVLYFTGNIWSGLYKSQATGRSVE